MFPEFLYRIVRRGIALDFFFGRLMTNGVWFRNKNHLNSVLLKLYDCGYDGSICTSVDAFHKSNLNKIVLFIKTALKIWGRGDLISIASVRGAADAETLKVLRGLALKLSAKLKVFSSRVMSIKSDYIFIPISFIDISPVGRASNIKNPWDGKWFKEDFCAGPGNVFMVMPDGLVKPCCGYAGHNELLTVGDIKCDNAASILKNIKSNYFTRAIFTRGLTGIRKSMEKKRITFISKTTNHCFFCNYLLERIPSQLLKQILTE